MFPFHVLPKSRKKEKERKKADNKEKTK